MNLIGWFERENLSPTWVDIMVALRKNLISTDEIVAFAESRLSTASAPAPSPLESLACTFAGENEVVRHCVSELARLVDSDVGEHLALRRLRYVLLRKVLAETNDPMSVLVRVERIYSDFDYPQDMDHLIYYMPPTDGHDPAEHTETENVERLMKLIQRFMESEHSLHSNEPCNMGTYLKYPAHRFGRPVLTGGRPWYNPNPKGGGVSAVPRSRPSAPPETDHGLAGPVKTAAVTPPSWECYGRRDRHGQGLCVTAALSEPGDLGVPPLPVPALVLRGRAWQSDCGSATPRSIGSARSMWLPSM